MRPLPPAAADDQADGGRERRDTAIAFDESVVRLRLDDGARTVSIAAGDIAGCDWAGGGASAAAAGAPPSSGRLLRIYAYPLEKRAGGKRPRRVRHVYTLRLEPGAAQSEDSFAAECRSIVDRVRSAARPSQSHSSTVIGDDGAACDPLSTKKLLVLVNPFSGPGKAMEIFESRVEPVLAEAGIAYELKVTERRGHAAELVQSVDGALYGGIAIVSGDGLPHEILNGMMRRSDRSAAFARLPLLVIPGGSGNGLAAAVAFAANEPYGMDDFAMEAALMVAQRRLLPLKLVHIQTGTEHLAAMMSVTFGIISDIDIDSEKMRKTLGSGRFYLYGYIRTMNLKKYRARVSYLPCERHLPPEHFGAAAGAAAKAKTKSNAVAPRPGDDSVPMGRMRPAGETDGRRCSDTDTAGTAYRNLALDEDEAPPDESDYDKMERVWRSKYTAGSDRVPRLNEPIPSDWVTLDAEFTMVTAAFLSHIQADAPFLPWAPPLDEKVIYLCLSPAEVTSRLQMARFLLTLDAATHFRVPCVQVIPVHAFRLEPASADCKIVVDGELVERTPAVLQGAVTSHEANVFCRRPADARE